MALGRCADHRLAQREGRGNDGSWASAYEEIGDSMITITMTPASRAAVNDMLDRLESIGDRLGPSMIDAGIDLAHGVILSTFQGEGVGIVGGQRWQSLAERTQRERKWLNLPGIGPEHPILIRTGSLLESLVDEGSPGHVMEKMRVGQGSWKGRLGTTHPHFEDLQVGDDSRNLPGRPMWPVGDAEVRFVGMLNEHVMKVIEEKF